MGDIHLIARAMGEKEIINEALLDVLEETSKKILSILSLTDETIIREVLSLYFNSVFNNQINSLYDKESKARLELNIKGRLIGLFFLNNECEDFKKELSITNQAIYIDNPFIIDQLPEYYNLNFMEGHLKGLLIDTPKDSIMDGIIESVLVKEKLDEIYKALQNVVEGEIIEKSDNEFFLVKEGFTQPVLQSHICSLKRASFDDSNKIYMCESPLKVINFDKIPNPNVFV